MRRLLLLAVAILVVAASAGPARAGYEFRFADSSGNLQSSFTFDATVTPTIDIRVYLVQTGGDTGLSASGLDSSGARLTYDAGAVAKVQNATDITPNGSFDVANRSVTSTSAKLQEFQDTSAPVVAPTTGTDANRILVGTYKFTGLSVGTSLVVTADPDPTPGFNDNVLGDGTVLDGLIANNSAAITVTAVPEPGTLALTGLFAAGLGAAGLRRLRRSPV